MGSAYSGELRGRGRKLAASNGHSVTVEEFAELKLNALTQERLPVGHEPFPSGVIFECRFRSRSALLMWRARPSRWRGARAGQGSGRGTSTLCSGLPRFGSFRGRARRGCRVNLLLGRGRGGDPFLETSCRLRQGGCEFLACGRPRSRLV